MIFKDSTEINKKEKDKTAFKTAYNSVLPCFGVQRRKAEFHKS
jgi:hypothetical protein